MIGLLELIGVYVIKGIYWATNLFLRTLFP